LSLPLAFERPEITKMTARNATIAVSAVLIRLKVLQRL